MKVKFYRPDGELAAWIGVEAGKITNAWFRTILVRRVFHAAGPTVGEAIASRQRQITVDGIVYEIVHTQGD